MDQSRSLPAKNTRLFSFPDFSSISKSISDGFLSTKKILLRGFKKLNMETLSNSVNNEMQMQCSNVSNTSIVCRICQVESDEPLIQLCNCKGALGFYHYQCLVLWLQTSQRTECELCTYKFTTSTKLLPMKKVFYSLEIIFF